MAKESTMNKRVRRPEMVHQPPKWPPPAPTAYLTTTGGKHGYADARLGAFYDPLYPVYFYCAFLHTGPTKVIEGQRNGWVTDFSSEHLPAIEKVFTPMQYRSEPIQI